MITLEASRIFSIFVCFLIRKITCSDLSDAQITVGRLVVENNPRLTITNKETGEPVLSIPLVKYLLLTEAEGHEMTNQEYLDRQDEYNMTFFLDESMKWINTSIIINDWVVRFNELDM